MDKRRDSGVSSAASSASEQTGFIDPALEYEALKSESGTIRQSAPLPINEPPWYLFQHLFCSVCDTGDDFDALDQARGVSYSPPREASLLDKRAYIGEAEDDLPTEVVAGRMRRAAKATMLVTAFLVAIAQWSVLASGVKFFEDMVGLSENGASAASSAALAVCFLTSLVGGVLGDALWGNIKTLLVGLVGALASSTVLAILSFPPLGWYSTEPARVAIAVALFFFSASIGLCQTSIPNLVGDQCHQEPQSLQRYYNGYYALIQGGALLSRILFPLAHRHLDWFIAIALCMTAPSAVALLMFSLNSAVIAHRAPAPQSTAWKALLIVLRRAFCCATDDELAITFGQGELYQTRKSLHVIALHAPLPIFWGLYFQMFELWYLQARELDLTLFRGITIESEQATALNPLFDVILLLLLTIGFSQVKKRANIDVLPTFKILTGYICACGAFGYGVWLQMDVTRTMESGGDRVSVWLQLPQYLLLCASEVLVYPAALQLVYLHSPPSMRSFVQSCLWFFIGVGNSINVVVLAGDSALGGSGAKDGKDLTPLFIGYAAAMVVATIVYSLLMVRYHKHPWYETESREAINDDLEGHERSKQQRASNSSAHSGVEVRTMSEGGNADAVTEPSIPSFHRIEGREREGSPPPLTMNSEQRLLLKHQQSASTTTSGPYGTGERRIPISPRTHGAVYFSTRKSPRSSALHQTGQK